MERTIDELKEALSSLKVNSTGLAEPTRLYDLAGQCRFFWDVAFRQWPACKRIVTFL